MLQDTAVLLTTWQYLDEAEQLRRPGSAILHEGRILVGRPSPRLKALLPAARVEYVEKRAEPRTVFLVLVGGGNGGKSPRDGTAAARSATHN